MFIDMTRLAKTCHNVYLPVFTSILARGMLPSFSIGTGSMRNIGEQ